MAGSSTQGGASRSAKSVTVARKSVANFVSTQPTRRRRRKAWSARKSTGATAPRLPMCVTANSMDVDAAHNPVIANSQTRDNPRHGKVLGVEEEEGEEEEEGSTQDVDAPILDYTHDFARLAPEDQVGASVL
ncbi:hypothetical protein VKT23_009900 [Stygiomarasmius scandens]|uniref:Uncharacterized protein n=1 Tax=Marasmiellus scandens TaxID=2682957 RepID=A0ABR1JEL7_9AGAR